MWLFHNISCFCISDMNLFYNKMSSLGYQLKKGNYVAEYFEKEQNSNYIYSALPEKCFSYVENVGISPKWDYVTKNMTYRIFRAKENELGESMILPNVNDRWGKYNILGSIIFPFCLYKLGKNIIDVSDSPMIMIENISIIIIFMLFGIGFLWSSLVELQEIHYFRIHGCLLPYNRMRFYVSIAVFIIHNLACALAVLMMIYMLFTLA